MAIPCFLAMTGAEIGCSDDFAAPVAWMSCHFSPWGDGLSNLPPVLPPGSLLILDDQTPWEDHAPDRILSQLEASAPAFSGLLLDFQRPGIQEVQALASMLDEALPCPVAVTALYARETTGPVFLPPLPCHVPLGAHLAPWAGREAWLELALDREVITLTQAGAEIAPGDFEDAGGFIDENLHCHYSMTVEKEKAIFHLWRTVGNLAELIQEAEALGIQRAVGLYQELRILLPGGEGRTA